MKNRPPAAAFVLQASEALISLLRQVSWIQPQDIRLETSTPDERIHVLANIKVLGRNHTLACAVHHGAFDEGLDSAIFNLYNGAAVVGNAVLPVLIASCLSAEAQSLCRENRIAYLDLKGNARIDLGEVFIARHAVPQQVQHHVPDRPVRREPASVAASSQFLQASAGD
jgi:hypothetical protein